MKPGKHQYMIKYKDSREKRQAHTLKRMQKQKIRKQKTEQGKACKPYNHETYHRLKNSLKTELFVYKCDVPAREEEIP